MKGGVTVQQSGERVWTLKKWTSKWTFDCDPNSFSFMSVANTIRVRLTFSDNFNLWRSFCLGVFPATLINPMIESCCILGHERQVYPSEQPSRKRGSFKVWDASTKPEAVVHKQEPLVNLISRRDHSLSQQQAAFRFRNYAIALQVNLQG